MSQPIGNRYVAHSPVLSMPKGVLYSGEDLSLKREVFIYLAEGMDRTTEDEYNRKMSTASSFFHERFQHILDSAVEDGRRYVVLRHRNGKPLVQDLRQRIWSFPRVVEMAADLGKSMLEAMEDRITGFSAAADNLWLGSDGKLSIINHWEDGPAHTQGAVGLCGLMLQLFTGSAVLPGSFADFDSQLGSLPLLLATARQKEALVEAVRRVCHGHGSLSSLVFDLRSLQQDNAGMQEKSARETPAAPPFSPPVPAAEPVPLSRSQHRPDPEIRRPAVKPEPVYEQPLEEEEEERTPLIYRNSFLIASSLFIIVVLAWFFWPTSKSDPRVNMTTNNAPSPSKDTVQQQNRSTAKSQSAPTQSPATSPQAAPAQDGVVPNLVGMPQQDAQKQALASGYRYKYFLEPNAQAAGTVFRQEPAASSAAAKGETVTIWVSKGNPQ